LWVEGRVGLVDIRVFRAQIVTSDLSGNCVSNVTLIFLIDITPRFHNISMNSCIQISKLSLCDIYGLENVGIIDISRYVMIKWTKSDVILTVYSLEISRLELYKITATSGGKNSVQQE